MKSSKRVVHIFEKLEEGFEMEYIVDVSDIDDFYNHFDVILERIKDVKKDLGSDRTKRIKKENPELFSAMLEIVNRYDPVGLTKGTTSADYENGICAIIPHLKDCNSVDDLSDLMFGVFYDHFVPQSKEDSVRRIIGDMTVYEKMAEEIWKVLQRLKNR